MKALVRVILLFVQIDTGPSEIAQEINDLRMTTSSKELLSASA